MWNTEHNKHPKLPEDTLPDELKERPIAEGDLLGNFVRRTDNDFHGVTDRSLIGQDVGDDEDEDEAEAKR